MFCKRTDAPKFASFQNHLQHRAMPRPVLQKICTMPKSVPTCCLPFTSGLFLWFSRIRTGVFLLHLVCMWYEVIRLQFTRLSAVSRSVLILMIVASKGSISTRRPNLIEMRWSIRNLRKITSRSLQGSQATIGYRYCIDIAPRKL